VRGAARHRWWRQHAAPLSHCTRVDRPGGQRVPERARGTPHTAVTGPLSKHSRWGRSPT
jgi:hypothetical protein